VSMSSLREFIFSFSWLFSPSFVRIMSLSFSDSADIRSVLGRRVTELFFVGFFAGGVAFSPGF